MLSGTFPNVISSPSLSRLSVHRNAISGTIPSSICKLTNLVVLDISQLTRMRGIIPTCFGDLTALTAFRVTDIGLGGTVPATLCNVRDMNGLTPNVFGCDAIACPTGTFQRAVGRQSKEETPCIRCDVPSNVIGSTTCQWHDINAPTFSPSTQDTGNFSQEPTIHYEHPSPHPTLLLPTTRFPTSFVPTSHPTLLDSTFGPTMRQLSPPSSSPSLVDSSAADSLSPTLNPSLPLHAQPQLAPSVINESPSDGIATKTGFIAAISLFVAALAVFVIFVFVSKRRSLVPGHKRFTDETSSDPGSSVHEVTVLDELFANEHRPVHNIQVSVSDSAEFNVADDNTIDVNDVCATRIDAACSDKMITTPVAIPMKAKLSTQRVSSFPLYQEPETTGTGTIQKDEVVSSVRKVRFHIPYPNFLTEPNNRKADDRAETAATANARTNSEREAWLASILNPLFDPIVSCGIPCRDISKCDHETMSVISIDSAYSNISALFVAHGAVSVHYPKDEEYQAQLQIPEVETVLGIRDRKKLNDESRTVSPNGSDVAVVNIGAIFRPNFEQRQPLTRRDNMFGDTVGEV
jgi:hypothetical protein